MTALGSTASITAITAIPGSFKTTRAVWWIEKAIAAGEMVYVCNLNGLKIPGVIPWEDPTKWQELPPGSVLVVDEAQRFFRARRSGDPPLYIQAMETIRHLGVRLILITQRITYLDSHLRGLVGLHEHMMRVDGNPYATIVRNDGVIENTDELVKRKNASHYDSEKWTPSPHLFDLFESAQVHTVKRVIKTKYKRGLLALGAAVAIMVSAFAYMFLSAPEAEVSGEGAATAAPSAQTGGGVPAMRGRDSGGDVPFSAEDYVARFVPRMEAAPWSAPLYDDAGVKSSPELFCMSSIRDDGRESCTCITEQGTRYKLPLGRCLVIAREGPAYNPFRAPPSPGQYVPPASESGAALGGFPVAGTATEPGMVGSPHQGRVWGKAPETVRAEWSPGF